MSVCVQTFILVLVMSITTGYHINHGNRVESNFNSDSFNVEEKKPEFWRNEAIAGIKKRLAIKQNNNVARNVILFMGDGMSIPTITAARTLKGQRANHTGEETELFFESFPTNGLIKTYCLDHQIADSACSATAYLSGVKNNFETVGVTGDVKFNDCEASLNVTTHLDSIASWILADGRDAGMVTTTRITHASPSPLYARASSRYWENDAEVRFDGHDPEICRDIAHQLIHTSPGDKFKVILGGGRREFIPNTASDEGNNPGRRTDGRNLIQEWKDIKTSHALDHKYIWNRTELLDLMESPPEYLLGIFESDHMNYHMQAGEEEPSLAEMTEIAIRSLSRNEKGFFLFVEGGRIDHGHHENYVELSLDETLEMELAIKRATELVSEDDTLIVVTADHSHVMAINGYTKRGSSILGPSDGYDWTDDLIPYMTVSYTNGPGARGYVNNSRVDVTQDSDFRELEWRSHAEVPIYSETHGGDDVAIFAIGPHNHMFSGVYEQSQLPYLMAYAACIGSELNACNNTSHLRITTHFVVLVTLLNSFIGLLNYSIV